MSSPSSGKLLVKFQKITVLSFSVSDSKIYRHIMKMLVGSEYGLKAMGVMMASSTTERCSLRTLPEMCKFPASARKLPTFVTFAIPLEWPD
jgi:hypothetical protein